jgi:hypothetical protein
MFRPTHRYLKILPWYVNRTLDPAKARKVAAHLERCASCQREANDLAKLLSSQAGARPARPVSQARLDSVLDRIDRYEAQQKRPPANSGRMSLVKRVGEALQGWVPLRPALAAATCAAVILGIVALPRLESPTVEAPYRVLSAPDAATGELRLKLRFRGEVSPDFVDQFVRSGMSRGKLTGAFRIEPRADGTFIVILDRRPPISAVSGLLEEWRRESDVADAAIDTE